MNVWSRRWFMRGQAALLGLPFASFSPGARAGAPTPAAKACIVLFMHGGPSQIDTWDPKPGRETAGGVRAISTNVPGIEISERLPELARRTDRLSILRSVTAREGNHMRARYVARTGVVPQGSTSHPALGAWMAELRSSDPLPTYVAIGRDTIGAGFLGGRAAPLCIRDAARGVPHLDLPSGADAQALARRASLVQRLDERFASHRQLEDESHRQAVHRSVTLLGTEARRAFDLANETPGTLARYGGDAFGRGCLLARRLVEAGVGFVEVSLPGWDTHEDNDARLRPLSARLDRAMSALLDDLGAAGLLDETLVVWMGEFGRTPRINPRGGRDHYPKVASVVMAGAGVPGGQVLGATDPDGIDISDGPIAQADVFATMVAKLGLPATTTRMTPRGRPITLLEAGSPIPALGR